MKADPGYGEIADIAVIGKAKAIAFAARHAKGATDDHVLALR